MDTQDEALNLRQRADVIANDADREDFPPEAGLRLLCKTVDGGDYPTVPERFYKMEVLAIRGNPIENASGAKVPTGKFLYALNYGNAVPPPGYEHIVTAVPYRWVFRHEEPEEPEEPEE